MFENIILTNTILMAAFFLLAKFEIIELPRKAYQIHAFIAAWFILTFISWIVFAIWAVWQV